MASGSPGVEGTSMGSRLTRGSADVPCGLLPPARCEPLAPEYIWYYSRGMKRKTSVTLAPDIVKAVDGLAGRAGNRSAVIERAVRELIAREARRERDARELKIIDANADRLNREAEDVLSFQVEP